MATLRLCRFLTIIIAKDQNQRNLRETGKRISSRSEGRNSFFGPWLFVLETLAKGAGTVFFIFGLVGSLCFPISSFEVY